MESSDKRASHTSGEKEEVYGRELRCVLCRRVCISFLAVDCGGLERLE